MYMSNIAVLGGVCLNSPATVEPFVLSQGLDTMLYKICTCIMTKINWFDHVIKCTRI